jgi:hypothetical protein
MKPSIKEKHTRTIANSCGLMSNQTKLYNLVEFVPLFFKVKLLNLDSHQEIVEYLILSFGELK